MTAGLGDAVLWWTTFGAGVLVGIGLSALVAWWRHTDAVDEAHATASRWRTRHRLDAPDAHEAARAEEERLMEREWDWPQMEADR